MPQRHLSTRHLHTGEARSRPLKITAELLGTKLVPTTQRVLSSICWLPLTMCHLILRIQMTCSPDANSRLIKKDPDGKDWGEEEKGTTEDENGWMASPTQWTWVWVNSGNWWWTGRPGVLRSTGSQRVRHDWATEQHPWILQLWFF